MARRHKEVDGVEPRLQRRPRVLQDRPSARVYMRAALRARIGGTARQLVERRVLAALRALMAKAETDLHDVL